MKISEPATTLTDYALAILAMVLGARLWMTPARPTGVTLWSLGFFATAAAALTGGSFHGFRPRWSSRLRTAVWNVTLSLIGLGTGFMISGTIAASIVWGDAATRWLLGGLGLSVLGIVVQQSGWTLHRHFNHNDMYHSIQIAALYLLYRGVTMIA